MEQDYNLKRGIFFILLSALGFATMGMLVRAAGDIPFIQKTLFRNLIAFFIAFSALIVKARYDRTVLQIPKGSLKFLILRSALGSIGIFGNFYALDRMNISDAAMLNKMSPFFSVLASMFILGEKPTFVSVLSLIVAFSGSLLVIKPSFDFTKIFPALVGFAGGIGAGLAYTFVRKLHSYKVNGNLIIAFFSAFSCLLAVPYMIFNYTPMSTKQLLLLLGAGVAAACGQIGVTGAYFNAPASKISIYEYTQIIFSAILGFLAFGQIPDAASIAGYTIIIGSAAAVFFYNSHKQKTRGRLS